MKGLHVLAYNHLGQFHQLNHSEKIKKTESEPVLKSKQFYVASAYFR